MEIEIINPGPMTNVVTNATFVPFGSVKIKILLAKNDVPATVELSEQPESAALNSRN